MTSAIFNPRTLKIIQISVKLCSSLGSSPYDWDFKRNSITVHSTHRRKIAFTVGTVTSFLYSCFLFWRLVQNFSDPNPSVPVILWLLLWMFITGWGLIGYVNAYMKKEEVAALFKGVKLLAGNLERGEHYGCKLQNLCVQLLFFCF